MVDCLSDYSLKGLLPFRSSNTSRIQTSVSVLNNVGRVCDPPVCNVGQVCDPPVCNVDELMSHQVCCLFFWWHEPSTTSFGLDKTSGSFSWAAVTDGSLVRGEACD